MRNEIERPTTPNDPMTSKSDFYLYFSAASAILPDEAERVSSRHDSPVETFQKLCVTTSSDSNTNRTAFMFVYQILFGVGLSCSLLRFQRRDTGPFIFYFPSFLLSQHPRTWVSIGYHCMKGERREHKVWTTGFTCTLIWTWRSLLDLFKINRSWSWLEFESG